LPTFPVFVVKRITHGWMEGPTLRSAHKTAGLKTGRSISRLSFHNVL
jgi:hypothetical protein